MKPNDPARMSCFQEAVGQWMADCFGDKISKDPLERVIRFLEEALELAQAEGMTFDEVTRVINYVYARPKGETPQEVGGVLITLASLCFVEDISMQAEGLKELKRINTSEMREKILEKQAFKRSQGLTSDSGFRNDNLD